MFLTEYNNNKMKNCLGLVALILMDVLIIYSLVRLDGIAFVLGLIVFCFFLFSTIILMDNVIQVILKTNTIIINNEELLLPPYFFFMKRPRISFNNLKLKKYNDKIIIKHEKEVVAVILLKFVEFKFREELVSKLNEFCKK